LAGVEIDPLLDAAFEFAARRTVDGGLWEV
jgi:hypothetical protein